MDNSILRMDQIEDAVKLLLKKYNAEHALLFGSYARGEADGSSDVDLIVFGGSGFNSTDIFCFIQDLTEMLDKPVDAYEICEVNVGTPFYENVMKEGVRIAA